MILFASGCVLLTYWDREPPGWAQEHATIQLEHELEARWAPAQVAVVHTTPLPVPAHLSGADPRSMFVQVTLHSAARTEAEARLGAIAADLAQLGVQGATIVSRYDEPVYRIEGDRAVACATLVGQVAAGSALAPSESCSRPISTGVQALLDDPRVQAHLHLDDPANVPLTISTPFGLRADAEHAVIAGAFAEWRQTDGRLVLNGTDDGSAGLRLQFSIPAEGVRGEADIGGSGAIHSIYSVQRLTLVER